MPLQNQVKRLYTQLQNTISTKKNWRNNNFLKNNDATTQNWPVKQTKLHAHVMTSRVDLQMAYLLLFLHMRVGKEEVF